MADEKETPVDLNDEQLEEVAGGTGNSGQGGEHTPPNAPKPPPMM